MTFVVSLRLASPVSHIFYGENNKVDTKIKIGVALYFLPPRVLGASIQSYVHVHQMY